jgi:hypothetical protein
VSTPWAVTVATVGALLLHTTGRPVSGFPCASRADAESDATSFTKSAEITGLIPTVATGTTTATGAVPTWPSMVAEIVAVPAATPVTTPAVLTLAMDGALLLHVAKRPGISLPTLSRATAVKVAFPPVGTVTLLGDKITTATRFAVTVRIMLPESPPLLAAIVEEPDATAVTTPADVTVATEGLDDVQVTGATVTPGSASTVACKVAAWPTLSVCAIGVTTIDRTPTTVSVALPVTGPTAALIVTLPRLSPVTAPLPDTVAMLGAEELHVACADGTGTPRAEAVAVSAVVEPIGSVETVLVTRTASRTAASTAVSPAHPAKRRPSRGAIRVKKHEAQIRARVP